MARAATGANAPDTASSDSRCRTTTSSWNRKGIPIFRGVGIRTVSDLELGRLAPHGRARQLHPAARHRGQVGPVCRRGAGGRRAQRRKSTSTRRSTSSPRAGAPPRSGSKRAARKHVFEWQKGSLFSIPVNAYHRIVNATGRACPPDRGHDPPEPSQPHRRQRVSPQLPLRDDLAVLGHRRLLQVQGRP